MEHRPFDPRVRLAAVLTVLALPLACARPEPPPQVSLLDHAKEASQAITAEALAAPIRALAADEMEGRAPGSQGDAKARGYLIEQLEGLGIEPGGPDGSWEQPFDMVGIDASAPQRWRFAAGPRQVDLAWWDDYIAASGVQEPQAVLDDAEVVFVGYGIVAPEFGWDDYKGTDVSGKVLVMLNNDPDWDSALFAGDRRLYYGRWTYKYESAAAHGAAAAIIVHTTPSAGYPWQVVQSSWSGEQFELPAEDEPRIQVKGWSTEDAARRLLKAAGHDLDQLVAAARSQDFQPVPLGIRTSLRLTNEVRRVETANVLGLLEGRDPELAAEAVVITAHHDHLGVGEPDAEGDKIYNGARDNASGVSQVLAMVRAFRALPEPPRRSVLFAFVAAEEQGLLGSKYYASHPTFPPGRIAANVNVDSANIWGATRDVTYVGYGKSADLDRIIDRWAAEQGRVVKGDQFPDRGFFYRSDQFSLAKVGVPAIYIDNGTELVGHSEEEGRQRIEAWEAHNYHQPSDEITDEWGFEGMIQDAQLGFLCALELAEEQAMPSWNPGDEFEAARLEAQKELAAGG